jgi:hypothetical protein
LQDLLGSVCRSRAHPKGSRTAERSRDASSAGRSVDGILCWNFFDYLTGGSPGAAGSLSPQGAAGVHHRDRTWLSKYVIMDEDSVKQRPYSTGGKKQTSFQNRDIIRMFEGLKVSESFLLKTNVREFLFRKPTRSIDL